MIYYQNIDINLIKDNTKFPIFLKIEKTHVLYVDRNMIIKDLKDLIKYPKDYYYISYAGKILSDEKLNLIQAGIKKNETLYLNVKAF